MNITFYGNHNYYGGLQNNGGSRTILLSAKVLQQLGHNVNVVAVCDKFTWFKHIKVRKTVPKNTDICIAISISDVGHIMKNVKDCRLAYWARPIEFWQKDEHVALNILSKFVRKRDGLIMCNSGWQVEWLNKYAVNSNLLFAGIDYNKWLNKRMLKYRKYHICCQYSDKSRKRWEDFRKLRRKLGDKFKYVGFGSKNCKDKFLDKYIKNPTHDELQNMYNDSVYFFAPNRFEGFYNCAAEAALCGCIVMRSNYSTNGMFDWADTDHTLTFYTIGDAVDKIKKYDGVRLYKNLRKHIKSVVGTREKNMKRLVELCQKK